MYKPIQIPYILSEKFKNNVQYKEEYIESLSGFILCLWEIVSIREAHEVINNIIIPDGCIDLVIDYEAKQIGYAGMSKTDFNFEISYPSNFFGIRFKAGAFHQLTKCNATDAMDCFLPIELVDTSFDKETFFNLSFQEGKAYIKEYLLRLIQNQEPNEFVTLFDRLTLEESPQVTPLYEKLNFSSRQCQRLCMKHFGISPKMIQCVIRFQQSLNILTSHQAKQSDVMWVVGYYDQPHYIKDVKKNIGITPSELVKKYR